MSHLSLSALGTALLLVLPLSAQHPLDVVPVATGLNGPVYATAPSGDTARLFIVEQRGMVKILKNGAVLPTPFLDVTSLTSASGERGLLGLAFHPNYAQNGWFFISYTNNAGNTRIDRVTVSANPDVADLGTRVNIFSHSQPFSNHNGGCIAFGADGMLYIGLGDGGSAGDPGNRAQNRQHLLGKMLRVDVDQGLPYTVPNDNPFVGDPTTLDEIWAIGLRNPWRFSFDSTTGDLWIGDVGQNQWEEINFEAAGDGGHNYGWRLMEGTHCFNPANNCNPGGLTLPVHEYSHGGNPFRCSVTGGFVYRGARMATHDGRYFFADYCSGQVWSLSVGGGFLDLIDHSNEFGTVSNITSFGQDGAGELYVISQNGTIYQIVPEGLTIDTGVVTAGQTSTVQIRGAVPMATVAITYSLSGLGSTSVPPFGVTLDLANPKLLSMVPTDAAGEGQLTSGVPSALSGVPVWVQGLHVGATSNVLARVIQ